MGRGRCALLAMAWMASACGRIGFDDATSCTGPSCTGTPLSLVSVGVGSRHACGLDADGHAYCWGANDRGQIATTETRLASPTAIAGTWSAIAAGSEHTCAIAAGEVWCWGRNDDGQSSPPSLVDVTVPTKVVFGAGAPAFEQIAVGGFHSCAIGAGQLWCWGKPDATGSNSLTSLPAHVPTADDWTSVALGDDHGCAISRGLGVQCWGRNSGAQVTTPASSLVEVPISVALPGVPIALGAGYQVSCAIVAATGASRGTLWCWGRSGSGLFGPTAGDLPPTQMTSAADWSAIAVGSIRACGILAGHAVCWGQASRGGLGAGYWAEAKDIASPNDLGPADAIALDYRETLLTPEEFGCLVNGATVACWGANDNGELGIGAFGMHSTPIVTPPPTGRTWKHVWAGSNHACATTDDNAAWCWGADGRGEVTAGPGHGVDDRCVAGSPCDQPLPVAAPLVGPVDEMVLGASYVCGRGGATIACWGDTSNGQLGGSTVGHAVVIVAPPSGTWAHLSGGRRASCGTTSANALACWGNVGGAQNNTPLTINGTEIHDLFQISFGDGGACATRSTDAARVCWGNNNYGELGDGTTTSVTTPVALDLGTIAAVELENQHGCAVTATGGVVCWGSTVHFEAGQLTNQLLAPAVVDDAQGPLAGCTAIGTSTDHSCALCGGRPMCWGQNAGGELGRGTPSGADPTAKPVAVPSGLMFVELAVQNGGACALASNAQLYCWGNAVHGSNGDGGHGSPYPTPVLH